MWGLLYPCQFPGKNRPFAILFLHVHHTPFIDESEIDNGTLHTGVEDDGIGFWISLVLPVASPVSIVYLGSLREELHSLMALIL